MTNALPRLLTAASVLAVALLTGCAAEQAATPDTGSAAPASDSASTTDESNDVGSPAGEASVTIDGREFTFQLSSCIIYTDGEGEAVAEGPGGEAGTDTPSFLGLDFTAMGQNARGEVRIDIGAEDAFTSSDDLLAFGAHTGGDFTVVESGNGYLASGPAWDGNGTDLGVGTMQFSCG